MARRNGFLQILSGLAGVAGGYLQGRGQFDQRQKDEARQTDEDARRREQDARGKEQHDLWKLDRERQARLDDEARATTAADRARNQRLDDAERQRLAKERELKERKERAALVMGLGQSYKNPMPFNEAGVRIESGEADLGAQASPALKGPLPVPFLASGGVMLNKPETVTLSDLAKAAGPTRADLAAEAARAQAKVEQERWELEMEQKHGDGFIETFTKLVPHGFDPAQLPALRRAYERNYPMFSAMMGRGAPAPAPSTTAAPVPAAVAPAPEMQMPPVVAPPMGFGRMRAGLQQGMRQAPVPAPSLGAPSPPEEIPDEELLFPGGTTFQADIAHKQAQTAEVQARVPGVRADSEVKRRTVEPRVQAAGLENRAKMFREDLERSRLRLDDAKLGHQQRKLAVEEARELVSQGLREREISLRERAGTPGIDPRTKVEIDQLTQRMAELRKQAAARSKALSSETDEDEARRLISEAGALLGQEAQLRHQLGEKLGASAAPSPAGPRAAPGASGRSDRQRYIDGLIQNGVPKDRAVEMGVSKYPRKNFGR